MYPSLLAPNEFRVLSSLFSLLTRDAAHNGFGIQDFFCCHHEITQGDHIGLLLILTNNQCLPYLFFHRVPHPRATTGPAYPDLAPRPMTPHTPRNRGGSL